MYRLRRGLPERRARAGVDGVERRAASGDVQHTVDDRRSEADVSRHVCCPGLCQVGHVLERDGLLVGVELRVLRVEAIHRQASRAGKRHVGRNRYWSSASKNVARGERHLDDRCRLAARPREQTYADRACHDEKCQAQQQRNSHGRGFATLA